MRWFRMYDEMLDDPKVQRLAPHLFRTWVNLLCLASKHDGKLPSKSDIAFKLRMSEVDAQAAVEELILAELIDIDAKGAMSPHNWHSRQFASDTSKDRTRKWRNRKAKNAGDVTVTACDEKSDGIESEPDTDTDKNKLFPSEQEAARNARRDEHDFEFGLKKVSEGKGGALETVCKRAEGLGLDVDDLIETVNRNHPKNRPAYFTTLCVNRLKDKLPGLDQQIIRDAIWGKSEPYATVCDLLLRTEAQR